MFLFSAHTFGRGRFRDMFSPHHFTFTSSLQVDVAALYFPTQYKHVSPHVIQETYGHSCYCKMFKKYFIKYLTEDFVTFHFIIATNSLLSLDTEHAFTFF